jgi:hypothetical protein
VQQPNRAHVFINLPFDDDYEYLYLALIAGLSGLGFTPRCVLQVHESGEDRLRRLYRVIRSCGSSIHDLSCIELSHGVPRFNMPFELGLAAALNLSDGRRHRWYALEARRYRVQKSLSDLNGYDPLVHDGKATGVLRCLRNVFVPQRRRTVEQLVSVYRKTKKAAAVLKRGPYGTRSLFEPAVFNELVAAAMEISAEHGL